MKFLILGAISLIEFSHAAPDFPLSPVFRFLIRFSFTYDHSALTRRWYLCRQMLIVRWTIAVRSRLIDNMPKTFACVGCANHNMMGKDISFYKFRDKTPNSSTGSGGGCNLLRGLIRMERGHLGALPKILVTISWNKYGILPPETATVWCRQRL